LKAKGVGLRETARLEMPASSVAKVIKARMAGREKTLPEV